MNIEENLKKAFTEHNKLVDRLIAEVDNRLLGLDLREMSALPHQANILLLIKAIKSAKAARQLINSGYGQDALNIARVLFEVMVSLEYISRQPEERSRQFLQYHNHRMQEKNRLLEQYGSSVVATEDSQYGAGTDWANTGLQEKSAEIGRDKEFQLVYYQLCDMTHSGVTGLNYYLQNHTSANGDEIKTFNAGPRDTATSDAFWLVLYFTRSIIEAVRAMNTPHFTDIDSGLDMLTNKQLVIEQVAVRLKRMFELEFSDMPVDVEFDTSDFKLYVKHGSNGESQRYSMDGDYEGFFLQESLLGYSYQIFCAACKRMDLTLPDQNNYTAYNF